MKRPSHLVKIFGHYYVEKDREQRGWLAIKGRRSKGPEGVRYLHEYLRDAQGVDRYGTPLEKSHFKEPELSFAVEEQPVDGAIASVLEGLEAETDVELLRRKVIRLANALAEAEKERDYLRSRLSKLEMAVSNYDNVILSDLDDASDKEKKLELLKVVFEENKKLRKDLESE